MTPVASCFVLPQSKKAQPLLFVFLNALKQLKQTNVVWRLKGLSITIELIKYRF